MKGTAAYPLQIEQSSIRKIFELQMKYKGIIPFSIGEPDFDTPPNIVDACVKALREEKRTHYAPNMGIMELRTAYAEKLKRSHGVEYNPGTEIMVTGSGMDSLRIAVQAIMNPGDEMLMAAPYWSNHLNHPLLVGAKPVVIPVKEKNGFMYDVAELEKYVTPKTKAVLLNSPSNPTGGVITKESMEALCDLCKKHDLYIYTDEVYQDIIYDGEKFLSPAMLPDMKKRTIICDSFSKTYAMTGWRLGMIAFPADLLYPIARINENSICCVNTFMQYAAVEALNGTREYVAQMMKEYKARRDLVYEGINNIDKLSCIKPKGAFYAFVNIQKTGLSSEEFAIKLIEQQQVALIPGSGFGEAGEGFVRISYATSQDNIKEGIRRMGEFVKAL